jgi:hypothetical protein
MEVELNDSSSGSLTGQLNLIDPMTDAAIPIGSVTGTLNGAEATWQALDGGIRVNGSFDDGAFVGTAVFPPNSLQPTGLSASLDLRHTE